MLKRTVKIVSMLSIMVLLTGCSKINFDKDTNTKVVLTTGFEKDEVFRIEKTSCMLPEVMVYLTNTKNQYENAFGKEIWDTTYEGKTLEDNIKETVLARLARVKALNMLAAEHNVVLTEEENLKINKAAEEYFNSLSKEDINKLAIDKDTIKKMYEEYTLANSVYEYVIVDINPEISDDEARTITVQSVLIKTYSIDENGNRKEYSDTAKQEAYQKATEALERLNAGEEFINIVSEYNEGDNTTYSFGKDVMESVIEETAFNLGTDEISDIIETSQGYQIIKCVSTFNRDETDRNKIKILEQRRKAAFDKEYSGYVEGLTKNLNDKLWNGINFGTTESVKTSTFFDVYNKYFVNE